MFAIASPTQTQQQPQFTSPRRTSPLSPRHHNAHYFPLMMTTNSNLESLFNTSKPSTTASAYKHVPARPSTKISPSQRRQLRTSVLLKSVKDRRQNARDDLRSEYILRSDWIAEQRAWEQAREAEAARWVAREEQDADIGESAEEEVIGEEQELEDMLRREEEEIQARIAEEMAREQQTGVMRVEQVKDGEYGSDDDMDMLFLEAAEEFEREQGMDLS